MIVKLFKLIISLGVCLMAGWAGVFFTTTSIDSWYKALNKPFFNPPAWVFAPVWTTLYILMGLAFFLVLLKRNNYNHYTTAIQIFVMQLVFNLLWTVIFFGLRNPLAAMIEMLVLGFTVYLTYQDFKPISKWAAYLMVPYLVWISFAAVLNLSIIILN